MATHWRLRNVLAEHNLRPATVAAATEGRLSRNSVYALARGAEAVRLETLDVLLPTLRRLTGKDLGVSDLIVWEPDPVPQVDAETRAWLDAELAPPLEPYDWGDVDPEALGNGGVAYVPGEGWVVTERAE